MHVLTYACTVSRTRNFLLAIAGGLLLSAAFPDVGWWWLAPIAMAILFVAISESRARGAFGLGFVFTSNTARARTVRPLIAGLLPLAGLLTLLIHRLLAVHRLLAGALSLTHGLLA